jgi:hypothetical protein
MPYPRPTSLSSSSSISTLVLGTDIDGEDGFIDSPPGSPSVSESSDSISSDQSPPTNAGLPLTLHTGPNTLIHEPLSQYLRGGISFNSFRAQVHAIHDEHLASLAPETFTSYAECSQRIVEADKQWLDTLVQVDDMKPGKMRLEGKILRGEVNDLREQIRRLTGAEPQVAQTVEDWVDEVSASTGGQVEEGFDLVTADDFKDMHEVPDWQRLLESNSEHALARTMLILGRPVTRRAGNGHSLISDFHSLISDLPDVDAEIVSVSDAESAVASTDLRDERSLWLD